MSYEIEFRFRPNSDQTVCQRHEQVSNYLSLLGEYWVVQGLREAEEPNPGEVEYFNLKKYTPKSLAGDLCYISRVALDDHPSSDDFLIYTFPSSYKGIESFDIKMIEELILKLSPYYVQIGDSEFTYIDKEIRRPLNRRFRFHRFFPVTYFDDILCKRMFDKSALDFVNEYNKLIPGFQFVNNGVLYAAPKIFGTIEEAELINDKVWSVINKEIGKLGSE